MSVIYEVTCEKCGGDLSYSVRLDNADDLSVAVSMCGGCLEEAVDAAKEEALEETK